jgi:putative tryptophan/tyrosine transport system substrate-binding protein
MTRRDLIALLGTTAAVWPLGARAQQPERMRRIVVLTGRSEDAESQAWLGALKERLSQRGWNTQRNLRLDIRASSGVEQTQADADELVRLQPDAVLAVGNPQVLALRQATQGIPIVFALVGDPVGSGFVSSLARPGGNITGFMHFEPAMGGKWLEILKETAPSVRCVLILLVPEVQANREFVRAAQAAGATYNVSVTEAGVHDGQDIQQAIKAFSGEPGGGVIALPNPVTGTHRDLIANLALHSRLPSIGAFRYMPVSGTLASYGIDIATIFRNAADYIDRILRGEKPADLPVQAPTRYELVINLKTAKALGLDVPPTLLARADEVIE